jgi:hypothetical protein
MKTRIYTPLFLLVSSIFLASASHAGHLAGNAIESTYNSALPMEPLSWSKRQAPANQLGQLDAGPRGQIPGTFLPGTTTRVSVATVGAQGDDASWYPSISANGRYVAFQSGANNLVPDDTNGAFDVFVHDQHKVQTNRVSVASDGTEGNGWSWFPSISADGRYVAFKSWASNLVPDDTRPKTSEAVTKCHIATTKHEAGHACSHIQPQK